MILYEDNHLLVMHKPAGVLTQPNQSAELSMETMGKEWIKKEHQKKGSVFLHAIHRLDKPVSGVVLFARTSKALSRLNEGMRRGEMTKEYLALVEGECREQEGVLEHFLKHGPFQAEVVSQGSPEAKKSILKYHLVKTNRRFSLIRIALLTGRYHQIRAQLAAWGHPIVGDVRYGSLHPAAQLCLHHQQLSFLHPISKERKICEAPPPLCILHFE